jgi:hypothetical protein
VGLNHGRRTGTLSVVKGGFVCKQSMYSTELREEFALQPAVSLAEPGGWYDCSAEEGIVDPVFSFSSVFSDPPIVTKTRFTASSSRPLALSLSLSPGGTAESRPYAVWPHPFLCGLTLHVAHGFTLAHLARCRTLLEYRNASTGVHAPTAARLCIRPFTTTGRRRCQPLLLTSTRCAPSLSPKP